MNVAPEVQFAERTTVSSMDTQGQILKGNSPVRAAFFQFAT
ncbi:hypothetical protein O206_17960 [Ochrobactrum sp. EGD-AQ16]|nr:hypothetical protein O206_17960 [Ochrobactrum sp. EGD-AQ16]